MEIPERTPTQEPINSNAPDTIDVINPITLEKLYHIEETGQHGVDKVYKLAHEVQPKIAALPVSERVKEVLKLRDYIIENREILMTKVIQETGKSRVDAFTSELFEICDVIHVFSHKAKKVLKDQKVPTPIVLMGKKSKVIYQPLGVVLIIPPWNYPLYQGLVPSIMAFLAGNAVIVKPSEVTPLKGVFEEIYEKSGFIKNAIQVVYGTGDTGKRLIDSRPDKIHFTGSCTTGKKIMAQASQYLIPIDLELGGKDPSIVFDDVYLERTVNGVMWGGFTTAGQSCTSIERLYVQENIYDEFVAMVTDKTKKLRPSHAQRNIEDPADCDVGCITTEFQVKIVEDHIRDAVEKGAKVMCGGSREGNTRHFLPTIIVDVDHSMKIMTEETFGPVIPIMKFKTEEEAIKYANDSPYGLSASVWSKDLKRCERIARALVTGNVSINNHMLTEGNPHLPFGGVKESGFGRYKGDAGLLTFSNSKSILVDKQSKLIEPHWYPFTATKYAMLNDIVTSFFSKSKNWIKFAVTGMKLDTIGNKEKIK
ncbi:MAG TPA: aldehyde dehydrogenase family protein [Flavobacteriales bacterium]|nr:aldehyde dehydrogenase family protein [Flavobacteriales bacterium]